jgi:uncharacterized protein involved in exopolysaccharide biosynthesis
MTPDIRFYLSLFLRRLHYFILFIIAGSALGIYLALNLPAVYRAEARLVVEAAQIPGQLAASTVQTSAVEILEVIQQRIITQENLLDLSEKFDVHDDAPEMPPDIRAQDMTRRISIQLPQGGTDPTVRISFDAPNGEMSAGVTNALVDQILEQNKAMRTSVAAQTLTFFRDEVARLDRELARQGDRILKFKQANKDSLPESLEYQRARQTALQERLLQLERELASLRDRRARLIEIYERTGRTDILGEQMTPEQRQLQQLKDQLASAMSIYSAENPRVISLKAQVAALEAANIQQGLGTQTVPTLTTFELQQADIDGQISFTADQAKLLEDELATLARNIDATPGNAIAIGTLERDYDNIRLQYTQATASLADARTGDQIEAQSRGTRVTVTQRAIVPSAPASPNRKLIMAGGAAGGIGLAATFVFLLELMNRSIRRSSELTARLGITPFGTIPYIRTAADLRWRRRLIIGSVLLVLLAIAGMSYAVYDQITAPDPLAGNNLAAQRHKG